VNLFTQIVAFRCWHACLLNFTGQNVIVACALLESCGRWLYRNPETHLRCAKFLERTLQLKDAKFMEANLKNLIDNAYYQCKPPAASAFIALKVRSPIHQYIRKCLYVDLNSSNVEIILRRLRYTIIHTLLSIPLGV
jgi:regulator of nonsense transcripts 2